MVTIKQKDLVANQKSFGYSIVKGKKILDVNNVFYSPSFSKIVFGYIVAKFVIDHLNLLI